MKFNSSPPSAAIMHQWTESALVQIMACRLDDAKPLSEPMLTYCRLGPKMRFNMLSAKWRPFCTGGGDELTLVIPELYILYIPCITKKFYLPDLQTFIFFNTNYLEENFGKIYLWNIKFDLPQWDMLSPVCWIYFWKHYVDGLVQDCSISIANTLEILRSCV